MAPFGTATPLIRRFALIVAGLMVFAFVVNTVKIVMQINDPAFDGQAIQLDFTAFWAAAKLALAGDAVTAFDPDVLRAAQQLPSDQPPGDILWLYPPAWHVLILPLGFMPFSAAYIAYSLVVFTVFVLALRPLARPLPGGVALVVGAPAVIIIMTLGNNSLLWIAGLAAALGAMARRQQVLAGLLIGLLTLKPQLGIMIPFALAFGGYWRTVFWACISTVVVHLVPTLFMGFDYWTYFFRTMRFVADLMQTDIVRFERMMSWYALARHWGADHAVAQPLQLAVSGICAAAVAWVWSRPKASFDIKAATLFTVIPLATPYAYHYEMTHTLIAALFLVRDGFGATQGQRWWLLLLWLGPVPGLALLDQAPPVLYAAPMLTANLALCVARTWGQAQAR